MENITLKYNPYTMETEFNDGAWSKDDFLDSHVGKELNSWCEEFLNHLVETYNDEIAIDFDGIERDCDTMDDAVKTFNEKNSRKIKIKRHVSKSQSAQNSDSKIDRLRELYSVLRDNSCPFSELRDNKEIAKSFNKAVDNEFEIAVVATMSSGKSTLINAMLGNELLPARNEATTATIARIHDTDNADHFSGKSFDKDGNELTHCDPLTLDNMNNLNDSADTTDIEIYGDIVGISSNGMKLVLTDTPGPNNSRTDAHKNHTYTLIRDSKYKPMVLYILNATQLETTDDNTLLNDIADAMREGGRQASDRFIFVLNKADAFDPEKESIEKKIEDTKQYLIGHGIKNPKVFPCSAYVAKLIRQYKAGHKFSHKEEIDLKGNIDLFLDDENLHFSDMAEASDTVRNKLKIQIENAKKNADKYEEVLVYTGIPAIELAISEYLEKYAEPQKITEAVYSFLQIINDLGAEASETEKLKGNQKKVEETKKAIAKIEAGIKNGEKGKNLKSKIDALSVTDEINDAFEELSGKKLSNFVDTARGKYCAEKLTEQKTKDNIQKIRNEFGELQNKFAIDIENLINEKVGGQAQKYTDEYNRYVSELLEEAFGYEVKAASVLGSLANMHLQLDNSMEDFEFDVKEQTGTEIVTEKRKKTENRPRKRIGIREKKGVGAKIGRWFGKLFKNKEWGYEQYTYTESVPVEVEYEVQIEKPKYENRTYINFTNLFNKLVIPIIDDFAKEAKQIAKQSAVEEEQKLKTAFKNSFDELDKKISAKLAEKKNMLDDEAAFENAVEKNKKNLEWLKGFKTRLKEMLEN